MTQMTNMTSEDRRRNRPRAEREAFLAAAFSPGAVDATVSSEFDVASSLIYTWRRKSAAVGTHKAVRFASAILIEPPADPISAASPLLRPPASAPDNAMSVEPNAITAKFSTGVLVVIDLPATLREQQ